MGYVDQACLAFSCSYLQLVALLSCCWFTILWEGEYAHRANV